MRKGFSVCTTKLWQTTQPNTQHTHTHMYRHPPAITFPLLKILTIVISIYTRWWKKLIPCSESSKIFYNLEIDTKSCPL